MSNFRAPVLAYKAEPHPNADSLESAVIDGWRAACRIGQFAVGQTVAYIPEGSLLPWELVEELGLDDPPRLAGSKRNRVKAIRLRGELSQGLVYGGDRIAGLSVGDDAVSALQLEKWVPPVPVHMAGTMLPGLQATFDIDDIKSWPDRLIDGEEVVITEKLHGSFCCMGWSERGALELVSSKGQLAKGLRFDTDAPDNDDNLYVKAWRRYADAVLALRERHPSESLLLFGEVCGPRVQDLSYGLFEPQFFLFDVRADGSYLDWDAVSDTAAGLAMETVPVLWRGPWSASLLLDHTDGQSSITAKHHREGIVVKPTVTRYDTGMEHPTGRGFRPPGRVVFKSV